MIFSKTFHTIVTACLVVGTASGGIYPEGHFDISTKITADNIDSHVKQEVDAGIAVFATHFLLLAEL